MNITIVAGARPNFIKIAPIIKAIQERRNNKKIDINYRLVHAGQHYDKNLSDTFFQELQIPEPDVNLNVGGGTQAEQTAGIMIGFEKEVRKFRPDLVIVVGDVNSTMACSIVAKKECIKVAHVEAGIRSGDITMPEEINRILTDSITDYFFTTTDLAGSNLLSMGVKPNQIFFVGNVMIDTLFKNQNRLNPPDIWNDLNLKPKSYFVLTLHRPSNVDAVSSLETLVKKIIALSKDLPIIFPVHPRTKTLLSTIEIENKNLHFVEPLSYLKFNFLVKNAFAVLTDSGGITEEATIFNVPCITFRDSTERPETIDLGTNILVGQDHDKMLKAFEKLFSGNWKKGSIPKLWDGHASKRIVEHLLRLYS
jgi:UDP-N-acetylglucosamine 2-epimerase (non-hydrolysing)